MFGGNFGVPFLGALFGRAGFGKVGWAVGECSPLLGWLETDSWIGDAPPGHFGCGERGYDEHVVESLGGVGGVSGLHFEVVEKIRWSNGWG